VMKGSRCFVLKTMCSGARIFRTLHPVPSRDTIY